MTFASFVEAVVADLRVVAPVADEPVIQGYISRWRIGDAGVDLDRTDDGFVLVHLVAPGVSIAPVEHPMTLRGVRDVANIIAAALDTPSELHPAE